MRAFDPVQLSTIELFCKAAELGSFTAAAELLGVAPASVSRSIKRLEERVGVRLFSRTTRSVRLTEEGALYWQQCRQALEQIAAAERTIAGRQQEPGGQLRISAGSLYANHRLLPCLREFTEAFPRIDVELSLTNRVVDIIDEGYDAVIRIGAPQDSRLIAHRLENAAVGVYATRGYLARHGVPRTLEDLARHDCLQFVLPSTGRPMPWIFTAPDGTELEHVPRGRFRILDDAQGCISWGGAGGGLFQTYRFIAAPALARGELVEVLADFGGRSRQFSLVYPQNRHLSARVRGFVDFMLARLRQPE